jgi:hypothetical protein
MLVSVNYILVLQVIYVHIFNCDIVIITNITKHSHQFTQDQHNSTRSNTDTQLEKRSKCKIYNSIEY